jgi:hypothetical protein
MTAGFSLILIGAAIASVLVVADSVPKLDVAAGCKAAAKVNKALDLTESQSYDACMSDEDSARSELAQNWASYPSVARERCIAETKQNATPKLRGSPCLYPACTRP